MIKTAHIDRNYLLRIAAIIPEKGLAFEDIQWLDEQLKWPQQPPGWLSRLRVALRACVQQKLLRFDGKKYYPTSHLRLQPLPPVKFPSDKIDPLWPEQAKRL